MEQKKRALGRGLEQLFDSEVLDFNSFESNILESASEEDIKQINLSEIRSNPYQPRKTFNQEALQELADSIKAYGVFQPIIVKKSIKGYDLVAGERRVKASEIAGLKEIPAIVRDLDSENNRIENLNKYANEKVIEINVTSPCYFIREINQNYNVHFEEKIMDLLINMIDKHFSKEREYAFNK